MYVCVCDNFRTLTTPIPYHSFYHFSVLQEQFIEKNNDALHASLEVIVLESNNGLVKKLFEANNGDVSSKGKLKFISVGTKFRVQLSQLMEKLLSTVSSVTFSPVTIYIIYLLKIKILL